MKFSVKKLSRFALFVLLAFATTGAVLTADCHPIDREKSISGILERNPGGKVLKIAEHNDENGCAMLKIRILVDGTVKVVTVLPKGT